jgi:DNA-binding transcriptional regulator LsrR (DeoR family)
LTYSDEIRVIARVARLYYEREMSQVEIANQLGLSQATVSRLLNRAQKEGIIRIIVTIPNGVHTKLEEELVEKFDLQDAIVVDSYDCDNEEALQRELGTAAAYYLENIIRQNEVIGLSSWSGTLLAMVEAMNVAPRKDGIKVVQILGGVGNFAVETHATHLTSRLAQLLKAEAIYLPVSGVVTTKAARDILLADVFVQQTVKLFDQITIALVGIGAVEPSPLLKKSGNIFSPQDMELLYKHHAAGDILLRFFDDKGRLLKTGLEKRVISMELDQLSRVRKAIGVAGGTRKYQGILGALRGRWINILITDRCTAVQLIKQKI